MSLQTFKNWFASPRLKSLLAKARNIICTIRQFTGPTLPAVALLLLLAPAAHAAIASVGSLATANNKASGSSWTFTTSAQLDINNAGVLVVAVDNQDTADINSSLCTSVSDAAGNDWIKAREFTNGQGAADGGATVCIFFTKATASLSNGGNVTVNFSNAKSAKAAAMWEFTLTSGKILNVSAASDLANDASDAGSMTISGLASQEYLFVRGGAVESNGTTYTASANYTSFTHTSSTTSGGGSASNMGARGEFRILTATTDSTNPTTSASDQASPYVALTEIDPPSGGGPRRVFVSQNRPPRTSNE